MGYRYTRDEISQVERLVSQGLTSREIAKRLSRSEAGIRNIRYRKKLIAETVEDIKSLQKEKKRLEDQIEGLDQTIALRSEYIKSLEDKKEHHEKILLSKEESMRKMIEDKLMALKLEKPELFYITEAEQIVKLGATIVSWLLPRTR
jgi:IS30 family transposase